MRKLSESVWGSIRKKSMGQEDRAEDGLEKFCEKLQSMYETPNSKGRITIQDDKICVYIFKNKLNMYTTLWIENVEKDRDYVTLAGTNPAKYRFSPSTMPLKVHTLGIYAVIKNNFKVEETESDGLEHWLHLKISHKDGSIFTNNDCINLIDLILNSIEDGKGIFPLISKNVNESVCGDLRKKSLGQEERLEDNIDTLFDLIEKTHTTQSLQSPLEKDNNSIYVPLFYDGWSKVRKMRIAYIEGEKHIYIDSWTGKKETVKNAVEAKYNMKDVILDDKRPSTTSCEISMKDGRKIHNEDCLDIIDTVVENIPRDIYSIMIKRNEEVK